MLYILALFKSFGSMLAISLALWGLEVTHELTQLIAAIAVVGVINFILFILDARKTAKAEAAAIDGSEKIQALLEHFGAKKLPLHIADLGHLSNEKIRQEVSELGARARAFEASFQDFDQERFPIPHRASRATSSAIWDINCKLAEKNRKDRQQAFLSEFRPDFVALWDEISRRLGDKSEEANSSSITHGLLAGPNPIDAATTELERYARLLANGQE